MNIKTKSTPASFKGKKKKKQGWENLAQGNSDISLTRGKKRNKRCPYFRLYEPRARKGIGFLICHDCLKQALSDFVI